MWPNMRRRGGGGVQSHITVTTVQIIVLPNLGYNVLKAKKCGPIIVLEYIYVTT